MYHNEIFKDIIKYSKTNELKPNILYYFIIGQDPKWILCIEDKNMTMEEFSTFLNVDDMEKHIHSILKHENLPFISIKYTTKYNSHKLVVPFSFQDINSIETSFIECFFAFEAN